MICMATNLNAQFAIRPTLRNHNLLKRESIIQKVASLVGPGHKVDLKNYDDLIVVEAYTVSYYHIDIIRALSTNPAHRAFVE